MSGLNGHHDPDGLDARREVKKARGQIACLFGIVVGVVAAFASAGLLYYSIK